MSEILRYSPVSFKQTPNRTEIRDYCTVVLEYNDEGPGPWIIDLSYKRRFDIQDSNIDNIMPYRIKIPEIPGNSIIQDGILINRMNQKQASIFFLDCDFNSIQTDFLYTDITEAALCIALIGDSIFSIMEKLSSLDFFDPNQRTPFLLQGPISHVPCQIITLNRNSDQSGLIFTCSRSYAKSMIDAVMEAGDEFDLRPAGDTRFLSWFKSDACQL